MEYIKWSSYEIGSKVVLCSVLLFQKFFLEHVRNLNYGILDCRLLFTGQGDAVGQQLCCSGIVIFLSAVHSLCLYTCVLSFLSLHRLRAHADQSTISIIHHSYCCPSMIRHYFKSPQHRRPFVLHCFPSNFLPPFHSFTQITPIPLRRNR